MAFGWIDEILIKGRRMVKGVMNRAAQKELAQKKHHQKKEFLGLSAEFEAIYSEINKYDYGKFLTPAWDGFFRKIEKTFLPAPKFSFLSDPVIMLTMFATAGGEWMEKQVLYLENRVDKERLKMLLEEDYAGKPLILSPEYMTSHSSIQHLYSLERYREKAGLDPEKFNKIVEWGGGYGNMAKIYNRMKNKSFTYTIIDIPIFSVLQWIYLYVTAGPDRVNIIKNRDDIIMDGKINLLPLCFVENKIPECELFISTWALSESSKESQDFVVENDFFGAKNILFANQESDSRFKTASEIGDIVAGKASYTEEIEFLPGNRYSFL
ncbi:MAG: hypothetical protein ACOC4H_00380 [bacterium]